jgi:hypothetical protein
MNTEREVIGCVQHDCGHCKAQAATIADLQQQLTEANRRGEEIVKIMDDFADVYVSGLFNKDFIRKLVVQIKSIHAGTDPDPELPYQCEECLTHYSDVESALDCCDAAAICNTTTTERR